ncbi:hypothetical protein AKJ16_DCAP00288 [Drosera capensis]
MRTKGFRFYEAWLITLFCDHTVRTLTAILPRRGSAACSRMMYQKGGCGGFGNGNFSELFKSIEEYEKTLEAARLTAAA